MQAILTKVLGPNNSGAGVRIKAWCDAMSVVIDCPDDVHAGHERAHQLAAHALRDKIGWTGEMRYGGMPRSSKALYCWVFAESEVI